MDTIGYIEPERKKERLEQLYKILAKKIPSYRKVRRNFSKEQGNLLSLLTVKRYEGVIDRKTAVDIFMSRFPNIATRDIVSSYLKYRLWYYVKKHPRKGLYQKVN